MTASMAARALTTSRAARATTFCSEAPGKATPSWPVPATIACGSVTASLTTWAKCPRELPLSTCGSGADSIDMDLADLAALGIDRTVVFVDEDPLRLRKCERVTAGAVGEGPNVLISQASKQVTDDGEVELRLACPETLSTRCRGALRIGGVHGARQGPRKPYNVDPGDRDNGPGTALAAGRATADSKTAGSRFAPHRSRKETSAPRRRSGP